MLKKLLQGPLHIALLIRELLILILHKDFITTQVIIGLGLVLLYLVPQELAVASLLAAFLIPFLIQGLAYLIIMMKTYGWHLEVEVSVGVGLAFAVMVLALLTAVSLLALSLSCILQILKCQRSIRALPEEDLMQHTWMYLILKQKNLLI